MLPDGTLVKGAQGNFPADRAIAWDYEHFPRFLGPLRATFARSVERVLYGAPWLGPFDPAGNVGRMGVSELAAMHWLIPPGVMARHGTSPARPARTPDLIGVKDRRYLDSTGLVRHREIGDRREFDFHRRSSERPAKFGGRVPLSVGTDPDSALNARRGAGYYKVPSLKGVWRRGPFEHNGSVMTLKDWFDPRRLRDDYVPTGFKGYNVQTRAIRGHEYGLDLSPEDNKLLIAFLKTL